MKALNGLKGKSKTKAEKLDIKARNQPELKLLQKGPVEFYQRDFLKLPKKTPE